MKALFVALLFFVISTPLLAQPSKEVEAAVEKLRLAMIDPTTEALTQLTSANLTYGHSNGMLENQSQFIEALVSGKSDFKTINLSDQTIAFNGKNIAMVRHKLRGETVSPSGTAPVNLGILTIWVKEKGAWKLLARQAFKL